MEPTICTAFTVLGDGDFVPEDLTRAIGLQPTRSHHKGEINRSGRPWKESSWSVELGPDPSLDHGAQVERLVGMIEPAAAVLDEFRSRLMLETWLKLWWSGADETQSNPYVILSPP